MEVAFMYHVRKTIYTKSFHKNKKKRIKILN